MDRKKLETMIERECYKFLSILKEHAFDHAVIFSRRNKIDLDFSTLETILNAYKTGLEDAWMAKVDLLLKNLDKGLTEFSMEENPLVPTKKSKK